MWLAQFKLHQNNHWKHSFSLVLKECTKVNNIKYIMRCSFASLGQYKWTLPESIYMFTIGNIYDNRFEIDGY